MGKTVISSKSEVQLYDILDVDAEEVILTCQKMVEEARALGVEPKVILHPAEVKALGHYCEHYLIIPKADLASYTPTLFDCPVIQSLIAETPMVI